MMQLERTVPAGAARCVPPAIQIKQIVPSPALFACSPGNSAARRNRPLCTRHHATTPTGPGPPAGVLFLRPWGLGAWFNARSDILADLLRRVLRITRAHSHARAGCSVRPTRTAWPPTDHVDQWG